MAWWVGILEAAKAILAKYGADLAIAGGALTVERLLDSVGPRAEAGRIERALLDHGFGGLGVGAAALDLAALLRVPLEEIEELEQPEEDNTEEELLARLDTLRELLPPDQIIEIRSASAPPSRQE